MIEGSFSFDAIQVNTQTNTLTINGKMTECEPKLFELLIFFCRNSQRALSRDELIEHVWQGRVVSDAAVNRAISQLRKLIEPEPTKPIYIVTVSKVGYRFAVTPSALTSTSPDNEVKQPPATRKTKWLIGLIAMIVLIILSVVTFLSKPNHQLKLTNRHVLTEQLGMTFNPYFDESSQTLYALHKSNNAAISKVVKLEQNGSLAPLLNDNFYYTDVVANGDFLYLARLSNLTERQCNIVEFNLVTRQLTQLLSCGTSVVTNMALDSNNRLVYAYRESASAPYKLMAFNIRTARQQQLSFPDNSGNSLGHRIFAISNNQLAYINYHANKPDRLVIKTLNDSKSLFEVPLIDHVQSLSWFNDILLISAKDGLYQFNREQNTLTQLDYSDTFNRIFASKDVLFAEHYAVISNLYHITDNQAPQAITKRQASILQFAPSPTNDQLVYVESLNGKLSIKLADKHTSKTLSFDNTIEYVGNIAWSFDATALVANINDQIYRYDMTKSQWQKINHTFDTIHFVGFNADNQLFVSAEQNQEWNIWQLYSASSQAKQITFNGGYSFYFAESTLYYSKFSQDGLFARALVTNEERVLVKDFALLQWRDWQYANNSIVYRSSLGYKRLDLASKQTTSINSLAKYGRNLCRQSNVNQQFFCALLDNQISQIWQIDISESKH
ncbi:winged helix-turn-helix domain-containing protein [Pseudoalteromonas sp. MMG024]|uniref:winged helix-turn-helix domain-containing protein n=1 Tax=Pseudoalteromonas sp. MMG024 TaxID=2909980 RepID=UPI001F01F89B|nr:winged helix-turn-helix domain-containing protein [Pseudoalteromonas sp. MMG024]MCF6458930.1 winged helix-turn-helix domain-containing protein [Pseudoalteromonas sp. MMG024]